LSALVLFGTLCLTSFATAQRVGDKIMPKMHAKFMVGSTEVSWSKATTSWPPMVTKTNGEWLWVGRSWVDRADVVLLADAPAYYTEYLRNNPNSSAAYINRGLSWDDKGEYDNAIKDYTEAIRLRPEFAMAYRNRGVVWKAKGEYDNAIKDYTEAIRLRPEFAIAYNNRGNSWYDKGELDNAIKDFTEAIRLNPKYESAYIIRGIAWYDKGEYDNAIKDFTEAIRLNPEDAMAYNNRGNAWEAKGEYDNAIKDYTEAIRLDPKYVSPYNGLAWILATCSESKFRDGQRAVSLARKACELTNWKNGDYLDTLAAAYAETGDFKAAVKWETKAHEFFSESNKKKYRYLLELYKAGKPYQKK